jgi:TPR repeat protein
MQDAEPIAELASHAERGDCDAQYRLGVLFLSGQRAEQDLTAAHRWLHAAAVSGHAGAKALADKIGLGGRSSPTRHIRCPMWIAAIPVLALAGLSMSAGYEASEQTQRPLTVAQGRAPNEFRYLAPKDAASSLAANYSLQPLGVHAIIHASAPAATRHKARSHKSKGK